MWGLITALLPFLPGAVVGVWRMAYLLTEGEYCQFFFALLFFVPGVVLGTPMYMAFVMLTSCIKFFKPDLGASDDLFCCIDGDMVLGLGPMLRLAEIVGESCPQSMLGRFPLKIALFVKSNEVYQDDCHIIFGQASTSKSSWAPPRHPRPTECCSIWGSPPV